MDPTSPALISQPSKSFPWPLILIIIFLLTSTGVLAYQYFQLKSQVSNLALTATPAAPLPSSSPDSPDPTTDWKTYTNENLKFSLNFPSSFNIYETQEGPQLGERVDFSPTQSFLENNYWFWISVSPNSNQLTAEAAASNYLDAKSTYKDGKYVSINDQPEIASRIIKKNLTINGVNAVSLYPIPSQTDAKIVYLSNQQWVFSIVLQVGTIPIISDEAMNIFDQILSSFKFTN
ncbi:MAG: hypothetical protein U0946_05235 [Patescibacteria group bacterium]|nr:hypothetical protein [Patescibacteria group bacterium]